MLDTIVDALNYQCSFYASPGSYRGEVLIDGATSETCSLTIPEAAGGCCIHIILEIHDTGSPERYAYRRVILEEERSGNDDRSGTQTDG